MRQYTYRLTRQRETGPAHRTVYRLEELQAMTTYHLKEICRREQLVVPGRARLDREELIRFLMRSRGAQEYRHIRESGEGGLEAMQGFLDRIALRPDASARIEFPAHLVLYEGEGIGLTDHYHVGSDIGLYEGNVLLVDEDYRIVTCFYLKRTEGSRFFLMKGKDVPIRQADGHRCQMLYFKKDQVSELLYDIYHGAGPSIPGQADCVLTPLLAVDIRQPQETELPLIIDFGSSNTTMGIYCEDGSCRIVRSADLSGDHYRESELIPSIIGVKGSEGGRPVYCFGYEAKELAGHVYPDEDTALFYDIKRWVSAPDRLQQVITADGAKLMIKRSDMLSAFLHYLIDLAQQQLKYRFRNIQILAPVRQAGRFAGVFRELVPDRNVECELDEGRAVLFQSIRELIESGRYEEGAWYQALVMDCGGGTADLTSGRFCIRNNRVSYEVDLETGYENGNTDFGGNNLTFRILQLMKLRLLEATGHPQFHLDLQAHTGRSSGIYETLDELYDEAEGLLPTRFADYEARSRDAYFRVKHTYYYLFRTAEAVKESFFQQSFRYELRIGTEGAVGSGGGMQLDKWRIAMMEAGSLTPLQKELSFTLYLYEIENLLRPDIYGLMDLFLERLFAGGELSGYSMLRLTGQSCKSGLFMEALKEYVPGRLIRNERGGGSGSELKMCCLEGALSYFKDCKLGYMKVNQGYRVNALPYEVMAYTHENKEKILIHSLRKGQDIGYISRFKIGEQLDLYLDDEKGNRLTAYHYTYNVADFAPVTRQDIDKRYAGTVIQEETDTIVEGEIKFFVWPSRERWGFIVLPVLRENDLLRQGAGTFFAFEDDTWEKNFFDGNQ